MRDEAHVRLVDAHAESDGRYGDDAVILQKAILISIARLLIKSGVIGERVMSLRAEIFRQILGALA